VRRASAVVLLAAGLGGCNGVGYLMGLRQDKADRKAVAAAVAGQRPGAAFVARGLLKRPWTRLWVFSDRATTQGIEDRIGVPFPRSDQPVARGASYLVWTDATHVLAAFSVPGGRPGSFGALRGVRPLVPSARLVVLPDGGGVARAG
jgi:hypothetical protein